MLAGAGAGQNGLFRSGHKNILRVIVLFSACCAQVVELGPAELTPARRAELLDVSRQWQAGKPVNDRQLRLLVRHADFAAVVAGEPGGPRIFAALGEQGRVAGFLLLDPLHRGER